MRRITFIFTLVVLCLTMLGCAPTSGTVNGEFTPNREIIPSNVNALRLWRTLGRGEIRQVALSPDGRTFAVASTLGIWLYDAAQVITTAHISEPPVPRLLAGHVGDVTTIAFSPDSARLASGGADSTVRLWDVASGSSLGGPLLHSAAVSSVVFSPDGALLATASVDGNLRLWRVASAAQENGTFGSQVGDAIRQNTELTSVAFSPLSGATIQLAAGGMDRIIHVWTLNSDGTPQGRPLQLQGFAGVVMSVAFSPDGTLLASGHQDSVGGDNNVHLWDMAAHEQIGELAGHTAGVQSVSFSPSGFMIASASRDGTVRLWNVSTQRQILYMDKHAALVTNAVFSPDNAMVISGGNDGKVRILSLAMGGQANQISGFGSSVISVAFSPDGSLIAAGTDDNAVHLWDVASGEEVATLRGHRGAILAVAFSPDGTRLASGSSDRTILLWNVAAALGAGEISPCDRTTIYRGLSQIAQQAHPCNTVVELIGHNNAVRSLAFTADGHVLASGGCAQLVADQCIQGEIRLWDVDMAGELSLLLEHNSWVDSVAFSPDGTRLASGSADETINIWDVETGHLLNTLYGQLGAVESVAFSADGGLLTSGGGDEHVLIWNLEQPNETPRVLAGHLEEVTDVTFSPNGRLIVSSSSDDQVRVWDVRSGIPLADLTGHIGDVNSVSFRQDGTVFASGGADGTLRLWGVP